MKKKIIIGVISVVLVMSLARLAFSSQELLAQIVPFKIFVNGTEKAFENPVVTINDRTYIPLREVGETLGMDVNWNGDEQEIHISSDKRETGEDWDTFWVDTPEHRLYGYKDKNEVVKIEPQWEYATDFRDEIAIVGNYIEDWIKYPPGSEVQILRYGYIDTSGRLITPIKFIKVERFSEGKALVTEEDGSTYYIDREGNKTDQ